MLFPLNTHLAFYSAWWGLLFAWLLGLWCAALYVEREHELSASGFRWWSPRSTAPTRWMPACAA